SKMRPLTIAVLDETFAISRLDARAGLPPWALGGSFVSITYTVEELSIVCVESSVPEDVRCVRGWRCLKVAGPLDFSLTGVLASLADPLASASISLFSISTFDTDYLMIREVDLEHAIAALVHAGHVVEGTADPPDERVSP